MTPQPSVGTPRVASLATRIARPVTAFCFAAFLWSQVPPTSPIPEGDAFNLWFDQVEITDTEVRLAISFHADAQHNYVVEYSNDVQPLAPCDAWRPVAFAPHDYGIVFLTNQITTPSRLYRLRRLDQPFTGLHALLLNDTGDNALDGLTSDPTLSGLVVPSQSGLELEASLDAPDGPFVTLQPIPRRQHFRIEREQLDQLAGGLLNDGAHVLHLRTATAAGQPVNTFTVPFHLDTTPPQILLETDPPLGGVGLGEGATTHDKLALLARTEPGLLMELVGTPWTGQTDQDGWVRFDDIPLALGANLLRVRALDPACNEGFAELTVTRVSTTDCLFADDLHGWQVDIAPPLAGHAPGTVTAADCVATLTEGDSFVVALGGAFTAPATPSVLEIQSLGPTFDSTSTAAIKDAFEIAVVDDTGQPLTYVIAEGRDACFNLTEGLPSAALAQGVVFTPSTGDSQPSTLSISLAHLFPGQPFRLVCRLVNNDSDLASTIRLVNVQLAAEPHSGILLASSAPRALTPSLSHPMGEGARRAGEGNTMGYTSVRQQPRPTAAASLAHNRRAIALASDPIPSSGSSPISLTVNSQPAEVPAGTTILLTGEARTDQPSSVVLAAVTSNDRPVDALDQAGQFFARVTIAPGRNNFTFIARSASGETASALLTIFGTDPAEAGLDLTTLSDVTSSLTPEWGRTSFNEDAKTLFADLAIRNTGQYPVTTPLLIGITRLSDPSVWVLNADGLTPDGIPYFDLSALITGAPSTDALPTGHSTLLRTLAFHNPRRAQFTFELVVLGLLNRPPAFTTVPDIEVIVGQPYRYAFQAVDPDDDSLTYSLASNPSGLTLNAQPPTLNWAPTEGDQGTHTIRLRAEDGHGGRAEQSYVLAVTEAPPNRPPFFVSAPMVQGRLGEPYAYDALALHPDADTLTYSLLLGPDEMTVDGESGEVRWTPTVASLSDPSPDAQDPSLPFVPGFTVEVYAEVPDPEVLSFDAYGNLFVGRDNLGSGGGRFDAVLIHRIQRQGGILTEYGVRAITDPDDVRVDLDGHFSGVAGTVLVGGVWQPESATEGAISAIRPDQSVEVLVGPDAILGNVAGMHFDHSGRLVLLDVGLGLVLAVVDRTPIVLADLPVGAGQIAIDEHDNIYVAGADGTVHMLARDGTLISPSFITGLGPWPRLAFGPTGGTWRGRLYALNYESGELLRIGASGEQEVIGTGFANDFGDIEFGPDGALYVSSFEHDRIFRIAPMLETRGLSPGQHEVILLASDSRGGIARQAFTLSVEPDPSNHPPVIVSEPVPSAVVGHAYAYDVEALDPDDDELKYSLVGPPEGVTVHASSGLVSWQPGWVAVGSHALTVRVVDGRGGSDEQQFTINVSAAPILPDLIIGNVNRDGLSVDPQTLAAAGIVTATVTNQGPGNVSGPFDVLFFEDINQNGAYDAGTDSPLGTSSVRGPFAVGDTTEVSAGVAGAVTFPGSFVWAFVDSGNAVSEEDEGNNVAQNPVTCRFIPPIGQIDPVIEWHQDTFGYQPSSKLVMMTPAVADLDKNGIPDVIFISYGHGQSDGGGAVGVLRALRGTDGAELWATEDPEQGGIEAYAGLAVGDIDNDSFVEIIVSDRGKHLVAYEHDGQFKWRSSQYASYREEWGSAAIADLDRDGAAEILMGDTVFNGDGSLRWRGRDAGGRGRGDNGVGPLSLVADIDLDGSPEVIAGRSAFRSNGTLLWNANIADGFPAVGNFDADPEAEIVVVGSGYVYLLEHSGSERWRVAIPGGGEGGAPTVADFDGDGQAEIGVAGKQYYAVIETNGGILWFTPTQDVSSRRTGSSVFDFDGDGHAEVVYRDEAMLRIYRGTDGAVLFETGLLSNTTYEYPLVADVDADGNAEIVATGTWPGGIYVIGDANDTWVPTRQIWNQHTYHINNVNDDGTIPTYEEPSWLTHNTYRLNDKPGQDPLSAPDLIACFVRVTPAESETVITARIGNAGAILAPGDVKVAFYDGDPRAGGVLLAVTHTTSRMVPGASEDVSIALPAPTAADLWVVADDDGTGRGAVRECDEENNFFQPGIGFNPYNHPPRITSVPVTGAEEGVQYHYQVEATDLDAGEMLDFRLRVAPQGMGIESATGLISWAPSTQPTAIHPVEVVVSDRRGARDSQFFWITVADTINSSPVIVSSPPLVALAGRRYSYLAQAEDPDGDRIDYDLVLAPVGAAVDEGRGALVWKPNHSQLGSFDVVLRAQDERGGVGLQSWQIRVSLGNTLPVITSVPPLPAVANRLYAYAVRAQDAENDPLTFSLEAHPSSMAIETTRGLITWLPALGEIGQHQVTILVTDAQGGGVRQSFALPIVADEPAINHSPAVSSVAPTRARIGFAYAYEVHANDPDGDALAFGLSTSPTGMTISAAGLITWQPDAMQTGPNAVEVRVDDGRGGVAIQSFTVTVSAVADNQPPVLTSNPRQSATVGALYSYDAEATDPDADLVQWALDVSPTGMSLDAHRGTVRWTPTTDQLGEHRVVLQVADGQGGFATQSYVLNVRAVNSPPLILSTPPTVAAARELYTYFLRARDPDFDSLTFSLSVAPAGMIVRADTREIQWTPTSEQVGTREVVAHADDGQGGTAEQSWVIVITDRPRNASPVITSVPAFFATVTVPYTYPVTALDADGDALRFRLSRSPAGMVIEETTGLIEWTPSAAQEGVQIVTVAATDPAGARGAQTFSINVASANRPPVITSDNPTGIATVGLPYRYDVTATDPDGDPLTYRLASAPPGMGIDVLGRVTWVPVSSEVGEHEVAVSVSDSHGAAITQRFHVLVVSDTTVPLVNLAIHPNPAEVNSRVFFSVRASDQVGLTTLGLTVDSVPLGLDAAGGASLLASQAGRFTVIATATDAAGNVSQRSSVLQVLDPSSPSGPQVLIMSPTDDAVITAPVDVVGNVVDDDLIAYTLTVHTVNGDDAREIARGTNPVHNGILGRFDPSSLNNDSYILQLSATDAAGHVSHAERLVHVAGDLKLGSFRLSFSDLTVPVGGIPITVARTYDTMNAGRPGDFGFGWRLEFRDTALRSSVPGFASALDEATLNYIPFRHGTRVYVTLPGGRRQGFTFRPVPYLGLYGVYLYRPAFTPDAGVTSQLRLPDSPQHLLFADPATGEFRDLGSSRPYNPADAGLQADYTLTTKEGFTYEISSQDGKVASIHDLNGNVLRFSVSGITSSSGLQVLFERDPQGRIIALTDPAGQKVHYAYDANGDLVSVTDRGANTTRFVYDPVTPHYLQEVLDPLGRRGVRANYDAQGRLANLADADDNTVRLVHDPDNFVEKVVDTLGNTTAFEYDQRGNVVTELNAMGGITRRTYDLDNNMLSEVDPLGNTTLYEYDSLGNVTKHADPLGNVTLTTYGQNSRVTSTTDPLGNTMVNDYDARGNLASSTDAAGNVTRYAYDTAGNPTAITDAAGKVTEFAYDGAGRLSKQTDALGNVTTFAYDANGNQLTQTTTLTTSTGPKSLVTSTTYDTKGRPTSVTEAAGNVTTTEYDALGKTKATIDGLGHRTEFEYDERGQLVRTVFADDTFSQIAYDAAGRRTSSTDRAGRTTDYEYDPLGRLVKTTYPATAPFPLPLGGGEGQGEGEGEGSRASTSTTYDLGGRVIAQTDELGHTTAFGYDAAGRRTSITNALGAVTRSEYDTAGRKIADVDALGRRTQFEYDALGRRVKTTFADNTTKQTAYDALGRVTAETDQAGVKTQFEYDALGRLTAVVDALDSRTEYGYNEQGQLVRQKDANGHVTQYEYETCCQRSATVLPLGQRSTTTYNAVKNVASTTDFNGNVINFEYDVNNRLVKKSFVTQPPTLNSQPVLFTYTATGRRHNITDRRGVTTFEYDNRDRLLKRTDPDGRFVAYTYDAAGNRTAVITATGTTLYAFDELNRLSSVTDTEGGITRYTYDEANNVVRMELPNGTVRVNTYDALNRVNDIQHVGPGAVFASFRYTMGPTGNRTEVREHNGRVVNYTYDALYRLVRESIADPTAGNRTISYTMDPVGNRLTRDDSAEGLTTYTYDANDQLLTETLATGPSPLVTQYTYDSNGNTLSRSNADESTEYDWDAENRLVGARIRSPITQPLSTITLGYDSDGIRVSQAVTEAGNTETTTYLIDANRSYAQALEEWQSLNAQPSTLNASYTYGPHHPISQLRAGARSYYHADHLGSTRALTDRSGAPTDRYQFDAYGRRIAHTGPLYTAYLFAGERRDSQLGLDYLRARYLHCDTGVFLGRDVAAPMIGDTQRLGAFRYARGNPVCFRDPSGAISLTDTTLATAVSQLLTTIQFASGTILYLQLRSFFRGDSGIVIQSHQAIPNPLTPDPERVSLVSFFQHLSLKLAPLDTDKWQRSRPDIFKHLSRRFSAGRFGVFATIGAGPPDGDSSFFGGALISAPNRDTDVSAPKVYVRTLVDYSLIRTEDALIERLLDLDMFYNDQLPYPPLGVLGLGRGYYNSNSYIAGLLRAAGLQIPPEFQESFLFPGVESPVPRDAFGP